MTGVVGAPSGRLRGVTIRRLTAGWRSAGRALTLREHIETFGHLPPDAGPGPGALIHEVTAAGLTGRGGGAFPTGTKMQLVGNRRGPAVVVANGMESEPASEKDLVLLTHAPHLVLDGIAAAARAVGAYQGHLCLPAGQEWLIDKVLTAVAERQQAGIDPVVVDVFAMPPRFVASEETALVRWLNGGQALPAKVPPRPAERGVGKRPTLVDNVETLAHVALIARYGAAWFRQAGHAGVAGSMLTTVTGAVARPGVFEVEAGATVGEVLALAGPDTHATSVLVGGYGGTWQDIAAVAGLPFTPAGLRPAGAAPGAGILFVLPPGRCGVAESARILRYLAGHSARQCGPCMFGLPAIAADLSQLAAGRADADLPGRLRRRLGQIAGRGACRHPDGAVRMASSALTAFATDVAAHARRDLCQAGRYSPDPGGEPG